MLYLNMEAVQTGVIKPGAETPVDVREHMDVDMRISTVFAAVSLEGKPKIPPVSEWKDYGGVKEFELDTKHGLIKIKSIQEGRDADFLSVNVEQKDRPDAANAGLKKVFLNIIEGERCSVEARITENGFRGSVNVFERTNPPKREMYIEEYNYGDADPASKSGSNTKTIDTSDIRGKVVGLSKDAADDPLRVAQFLIADILDNVPLKAAKPHLEKATASQLWEELVKADPFRARLGTHLEKARLVGQTARGSDKLSGFEAAKSVLELSNDLNFTEEQRNSLQEEDLRIDTPPDLSKENLMKLWVNEGKRGTSPDVWKYQTLFDVAAKTLVNPENPSDAVDIPDLSLDGISKTMEVGNAILKIGANNIKSATDEAGYTTEFVQCVPIIERPETPFVSITYAGKKTYKDDLRIVRINTGDRVVSLYLLKRNGRIYKGSNLGEEELKALNNSVINNCLESRTPDSFYSTAIAAINQATGQK